MSYASKEELEAAERRPKGHVAHRRKRDGAWIYITASTAQGSATQRKRDAIVREKHEAAMREKYEAAMAEKKTRAWVAQHERDANEGEP
jgi:hypothetical protein